MNPLVPDFILQQDAQDRTSGSFEAAALFVDIAGFSAMTESLAPRGRDGAEKLAHALRFYFDPLAAAVHDAGGFITGFAGDACTALFPARAGHRPGLRADEPPSAPDPGRDPGAQALEAAHHMQRFVEEHPVYATADGKFPFSIRVGLSWGTVGWGIVRVTHVPASDPTSGPTSHRVLPDRSFYYFQGPPIDACAAVEQRARAGQVLLDEALRRRVPAALAVRVEEGIYRAVSPKRAIRRAPAEPKPADKPPTTFSGVTLADVGASFLAPRVLDIPPQGEFRDVVSVFVAFSGAADVPGLIRLLNELATGYGGTFTGLDFGDKGTNSLIHFGAPVSHENDTERALDFVIELRRMCASVAKVRAGVTRDVRYVGWNGGTRRREFACLGRGTNLAARLMMKAAWDDVLCDEKVHADAAAAYELEPRGELALKGFEQPVPAWGLGQRRAAREQPRGFSAKELVGRAAELARLLSSIEPVFSGKFAGLVFIDGEAGLGKSYLVETARRRLEAAGRSFLWIEAPCDQTLQRSFNAFEVALKDRFGQSPAATKEENLARFDEGFAALLATVPESAGPLRREVADGRTLLAALLGHRLPGSLYERLSPKERFERTLAAIAAWVRAESLAQPVIIHLEDGHWADLETLRAVQTIAAMGRSEEGKALPRLMPGLPVAVVCTARYTDDGSPFRIPLDAGVPVRNIALGPLSPEEIGRIAENVGGRPVPDVFRAMLIDGAGGNPFFAEEIFGYWRDTDVPFAEPSISSPSVALLPSDVNSLLVARLDRLPPRVKLTVLAAAVLGKEFDLRVLKAMAAGDGEVDEHVRVAEAMRIWIKQGAFRYRFRNTLLRNSAYEIQARARLQRLHLLAAEAIEGVYAGDLDRHHAAIARHYRRAGQPDKARPYFLAAAREAGSRYAHAEAKRHYKSYMKLVERPTPESVVARYELARDVYEPRGELARAHEEHVRVIEEAQQIGDVASDALGRLGLGRVAWSMRRLDDARTYLAQALAGARGAGNRWAEALSLAHLALVLKAAGLREEARSTFERALRLGREIGMHEGTSIFGDMIASFDADPQPLEVLERYEQAMTVQQPARG